MGFHHWKGKWWFSLGKHVFLFLNSSILVSSSIFPKIDKTQFQTIGKCTVSDPFSAETGQGKPQQHSKRIIRPVGVGNISNPWISKVWSSCSIWERIHAPKPKRLNEFFSAVHFDFPPPPKPGRVGTIDQWTYSANADWIKKNSRISPQVYHPLPIWELAKGHLRLFEGHYPSLHPEYSGTKGTTIASHLKSITGTSSILIINVGSDAKSDLNINDSMELHDQKRSLKISLHSDHR